MTRRIQLSLLEKQKSGQLPSYKPLNQVKEQFSKDQYSKKADWVPFNQRHTKKKLHRELSIRMTDDANRKLIFYNDSNFREKKEFFEW
jgi:hypothetical protein